MRLLTIGRNVVFTFTGICVLGVRKVTLKNAIKNIQLSFFGKQMCLYSVVGISHLQVELATVFSPLNRCHSDMSSLSPLTSKLYKV